MGLRVVQTTYYDKLFSHLLCSPEECASSDIFMANGLGNDRAVDCCCQHSRQHKMIRSFAFAGFCYGSRRKQHLNVTYTGICKG